MELKEPLSFQDQVKMLQAHGLCVSDTAYAEKFLSRVNYYKFTGYTLQFRMGPSTSDLSGQHTFEDGHEGTCKRVKRYAEGISLISINPAYEPMYYSREQVEQLPVEVVGRVMEVRSKV